MSICSRGTPPSPFRVHQYHIRSAAVGNGFENENRVIGKGWGLEQAGIDVAERAHRVQHRALQRLFGGTPKKEVGGMPKKEVGYANWNGKFKLPWREAGPPNHLDDKRDSDQ